MKYLMMMLIATAAVAAGAFCPAETLPQSSSDKNADTEQNFDNVLSTLNELRGRNLKVAAMAMMVDRHPEDFAARLLLADGLMATGNPDAAEQHVLYVLDKNDQMPQALDLLALCYMKQHRVCETVETIEKRLEISRRFDPDLSATLQHYQRAAGQLDQTQIPEDAPEYETVDRNERVAFYHIAAAVAGLAQENYDEADYELRWAYASQLDSPLVPYLRARLVLKQQETATEEKLREAALLLEERISNWESTFIQRYRDYYNNTNAPRKKALQAKLGVSDKSTLLPDLRAQLADVYLHLEHYRQALDQAAEALELDTAHRHAVQITLEARRQRAREAMKNVPEDLQVLRKELLALDTEYLVSGRIRARNERSKKLAAQQQQIARQDLRYLVGDFKQYNLRQEQIRLLTMKINYELPLELELVYGKDGELAQAASEDGLYPPAIDERRDELLHKQQLSFIESERLLVLVNLQVQGFNRLTAPYKKENLGLLSQKCRSIQKAVEEANTECAAGMRVLQTALLKSADPEIRKAGSEFYRDYARMWQSSADMYAAILHVLYPPEDGGATMALPEQLRHVSVRLRQYWDDLKQHAAALDALCTVNEAALNVNDRLAEFAKFAEEHTDAGTADVGWLAEMLKLAQNLRLEQFTPLAPKDADTIDAALPYREYAPALSNRPLDQLTNRERLALLRSRLTSTTYKQIIGAASDETEEPPAALPPKAAAELRKKLNALAILTDGLRENVLEMDRKFQAMRSFYVLHKRIDLARKSLPDILDINIGDYIQPLDSREVLMAGDLPLKEQQELRNRKRQRFHLVSRQLNKFESGIAAQAHAATGAELPHLLVTDQPTWLRDMMTAIDRWRNESKVRVLNLEEEARELE